MAFKILVYLLVVFCIIQCSLSRKDGLKEAKDELARSKTNVQGIIFSIKRLKTKLQLTSNAELTIPTEKSKQILISMIQSTTNEVHKDVKETLKKGKSAKRVNMCMKQADDNLKSILGYKKTELEACQKSAAEVSDDHLNELTEAYTYGEQLFNELNSVDSRCADPNSTEVQKCIQEHLKEISPNVKAFEAATRKTKEGVEIIHTAVFKTLKKCNSDIPDSGRVQIRNVKNEATVCLQNA